MREAFETGKLTEIIYYKDGLQKAKVTMTNNKCFEIREFDESFNYWTKSFETSALSEWNIVQKFVLFLLNK